MIRIIPPVRSKILSIEENSLFHEKTRPETKSKVHYMTSTLGIPSSYDYLTDSTSLGRSFGYLSLIHFVILLLSLSQWRLSLKLP
jgi:hypothetical protein